MLEPKHYEGLTLALGDTLPEGDTLELGDVLLLTDALGLCEALGETDSEGLGLSDAEIEGLTLAEGEAEPLGLPDNDTEALGDRLETPVPGGLSSSSLNLHEYFHASSVTFAISNVSPSSRQNFSSDKIRRLVSVGTLASKVRVS